MLLTPSAPKAGNSPLATIPILALSVDWLVPIVLGALPALPLLPSLLCTSSQLAASTPARCTALATSAGIGLPRPTLVPARTASLSTRASSVRATAASDGTQASQSAASLASVVGVWACPAILRMALWRPTPRVDRAGASAEQLGFCEGVQRLRLGTRVAPWGAQGIRLLRSVFRLSRVRSKNA